MFEYAEKSLSEGKHPPGREELEGMCLDTSIFEHFTESMCYEIKNEKITSELIQKKDSVSGASLLLWAFSDRDF